MHNAQNTSPIDAQVASYLRTDSSAHDTVNAYVRIAHGFARFVGAIIDDNAHAASADLRITDLYVNPKGRTVDGALTTYPTTVTHRALSNRVNAIGVLAILAARVGKLETADDDMPKVESSARVALAKLANLDAALWRVFTSTGEQHLDGIAASLIEQDGRAWASSGKGRGSHDIREDETAQSFTRNGKSFTHGISGGAYLSERDMIGRA